MPQKKTELNFEQSIQQLETMVANLEQGELSLEESLAIFEQGIKLTRECQQQLATAEQKVSLLIGDNENMQLVDFDHSQQD